AKRAAEAAGHRTPLRRLLQRVGQPLYPASHSYEIDVYRSSMGVDVQNAHAHEVKKIPVVVESVDTLLLFDTLKFWNEKFVFGDTLNLSARKHEPIANFDLNDRLLVRMICVLYFCLANVDDLHLEIPDVHFENAEVADRYPLSLEDTLSLGTLS